MAGFDLGDKVMVIYFHFKDAWPPYPTKFPFMNDNGDADAIELRVLTVRERHAVREQGEPSSEPPRHVGHVLVDKDDNDWGNEYPHAIPTGQTNHGKRCFNRLFVGDDSITLMNMKELYREGTPICGYQLTEYFASLIEGIGMVDSNDDRNRLKQLAQRIEKRLMDEFGCVLLREPISPNFPKLYGYKIYTHKPFAK